MTGGFKLVLGALVLLFLLKTILGWRVLRANRRRGTAVNGNRNSTRWSAPITLLALALPCALMAADRGTTADDKPHRDKAIHWPKEFDPATAPLFSHNELLIQADCHRVFARFSDATDWPNWFVLVKNVHFAQPVDNAKETVKEGTLLRLSIFNTPIETRITEFVPDSRLSWSPRSLTEEKALHYHTWHFLPESGACRVVTEETGIGPNDIKLGPAGDNFMHRAHDLWLASLKWTAEQ